jgi:Ankyrin repeats (3 copies)
MSIHDSAYDGSLTLSQLRKHCSTYPSSSLNTIGGKIKLTPLCAACLGGHLDVVKHFLTCGADPNIPSTNARTPLFFITDSECKALPAARCAIIRELISGKHGLKADLDKPCDKDQNTPLMNAIIQLKDKVVIEELVDSGASPTIQHYPTQKNTKELGEEFGLAGSLVPKAERDLAWAKIIDLVVTFLLLIIGFVNNNTVNGVVDGIVKQHYNISAKEMDDSDPMTPSVIALSKWLTYC